MKIFFLFVLSFFLFACAGKSVPPSSPAAGLPPGCRNPPLAKQRRIAAKRIREIRNQPHFEFNMGARKIRVAHGVWKQTDQSADWNRMYGWGPVVWVSEGGKTHVLDLRAEFPSNYVSQVYQGNGRIYLFLDYGVEGPANAYHVWISEDSGEHWFAGGDLARPPGSFPPSSLEHFIIENGEGKGFALFRAEASNLSSEERKGLPAGSDAFYGVSTRDGGCSWQADTAPIASSLVHPEAEKQ